MPKTKQQKKSLLDVYSAKIKGSPTFFVVKPLGLNPVEATAIKKELSALDSSYNQVKNSIFELAMKENGVSIDSLGEGQHAIVFSSEKASEAAKVISKYLKDKDGKDRIEIWGGVLDNAVISAEQVQALADLPSKDVLLAQLLSVMVGPIRGFMFTLKGNMQEFVYLLNAIQEKKAV